MLHTQLICLVLTFHSISLQAGNHILHLGYWVTYNLSVIRVYSMDDMRCAGIRHSLKWSVNMGLIFQLIPYSFELDFSENRDKQPHPPLVLSRHDTDMYMQYPSNIAFILVRVLCGFRKNKPDQLQKSKCDMKAPFPNSQLQLFSHEAPRANICSHHIVFFPLGGITFSP